MLFNSRMANRRLGRNLSRSTVAQTARPAYVSAPSIIAPLTSIQRPHRSPSLERLREPYPTIHSPLLQQSPISYLLRLPALPSLSSLWSTKHSRNLLFILTIPAASGTPAQPRPRAGIRTDSRSTRLAFPTYSRVGLTRNKRSRRAHPVS